MSQLNPSKPAPTLSQAYAEAQYNLRTLTSPPPNTDLPPLYTRTLASLHLLLSLQSSSISPSDFLTELPTSTLRLLLTPFHLAQTLLAFPGDIEHRLPRIRQAIAHHLSFLSSLDHLDGLTKAEEHRLAVVQQTLDDPPSLDLSPPTSHPRTDPAQARQDKIARYRQQKAIEVQLAAYEASHPRHSSSPSSPDDEGDAELDEDEAAREYWMLRIRFAVTQALDDLLVSQQELALLQHRDQQAKLPPPPPAATPAAPIIHRISSPADLALPIPPSLAQWLHPLPTGSSRPGRSEVFRDPNPATMSIEEWAEGEMRAGRLAGPGGGLGGGGGRGERTREERGYVGRAGGEEEGKRGAEGEEEEGKGQWGGEDEEAKSDAKTRESREWDNWKDDHEKGAGNRKGRR